jgi:hypothetical protein
VTVATSTRAARGYALAARALIASQADDHARLAVICAASLLFGAGIHVNVGIAHAGSNFGMLSLVAAAAQLALGLAIYLRRDSAVLSATIVLELVLLQLYAFNVTIGLPPAIAHVHSGGQHVVWGYTFALPGAVDLEGLCAVLTEIAGAASAALLLGAPRQTRS